MSKVVKFIENYITKVNDSLDISPVVEVLENEDEYAVNITGNKLSFLIGYRGTSLEGLQYLLSMALFSEFGEWYNLVVDINEYRAKRREKLEEIAKKYIDKVRFFNEEVSVPPMSPYERKQIHEFVAGYHDVESHSTGEGAERHIILKPSL